MTLISLKPKDLGIYIIGLMMILVPIQWFCDPSFGISAIRISQQQVYQVAAIGLFAIFVLQNVYLSLFLLWSLLLYCYFEWATPVGTIVLTILSACMIYEAIYRVVRKDNVKVIYGFMISFALINMAYMAMQGLGWELLFQEFTRPGYQTQMIGFMGLKAIMGMLFAMCIPFFAYKYPRLSLGLFIPLYVSECSSAMVAGIIAYLWNLWYVSKKWFILSVTVMLIGGGIYTYNDSHAGMFTDRMNMWKVVLRDAMARPIFGWGPDSFRCVTPQKQFMYWKNNRNNDCGRIDVRDTVEYQNTGKYDLKKYGSFMNETDSINPWDNPHNEYVQLFYEFGVVGLVLLGLLSWDIHRRFNSDNGLLVPLIGFFFAVLIISVGQFPFHLARVGLFIPIFLACYYKLTENHA